MTTLNPPKNIFFFGNQGVFSASVFNQILQQGLPISRVFCACIGPASAPKKVLPVSSPTNEITLEKLAQDQGIPIEYIQNQSAFNSLITSRADNPDYVLVACFPYRLPASIIDWPQSGCLNIHPSLLPRYRGPDPVFWQLHKNESQTGVTLHFVSSELDSGPIVDQILCPFEDGSSRRDIDAILARTGAKLFTSFITAGNTQNFIATQQDESHASYFPNPSADNYEISPAWSARHAFNFIRGTHSPSGYFTVKSENEILKVISALKYSNNDKIKSKTQNSNNELFLQLSPGILHVTIG